MFSQSTYFLFVLFLIGLIAKNQSLIIAVGVLLIVKVFGLGDKLYPVLQNKGLNIGVTIITIAVLVPIATGEIGFKQLIESVRSFNGWVALLSGIAVALLAAKGISLLSTDPHLTTAMVFGTIFAVALFKGVAVGPLVASGIAYVVLKVISYFVP